MGRRHLASRTTAKKQKQWCLSESLRKWMKVKNHESDPLVLRALKDLSFLLTLTRTCLIYLHFAHWCKGAQRSKVALCASELEAVVATWTPLLPAPKPVHFRPSAVSGGRGRGSGGGREEGGNRTKYCWCLVKEDLNRTRSERFSHWCWATYQFVSVATPPPEKLMQWVYSPRWMH